MRKEIRKFSDLKDKTIVELKQDSGDLWIKFQDGTFVVLVVNDITEPYGYTKNEVGINKFKKDNTDHTLVDLGIISNKEYKDACDQEEIEYQKRQELRDDQEKERIKNIELEQFEKLKSKYGL